MPAAPVLELGTATAAVPAAQTAAAHAVAQAISPSDKAKLYAETDARFVAQTGITRKLNPKNAVDAKLVPLWNKLYQQVVGQFLANTLTWTHDHPGVAASIDDARAAGDVMAGHLHAVAIAPDPQARAQQAAAAAEAHKAAVDSAIRASLLQGILSQGRGPILPPFLIQDTAHQIGVGAAAGALPVADGSDAATAIQAVNAPSQSATATTATAQASAATAPAGPNVSPDQTQPARSAAASWMDQHGETAAKVTIIGAAVAGILGLALGADKSRGRSGGRRRRSGPIVIR